MVTPMATGGQSGKPHPERRLSAYLQTSPSTALHLTSQQESRSHDWDLWDSSAKVLKPQRVGCQEAGGKPKDLSVKVILRSHVRVSWKPHVTAAVTSAG